jgi:hypothetical protein
MNRVINIRRLIPTTRTALSRVSLNHSCQKYHTSAVFSHKHHAGCSHDHHHHQHGETCTHDHDHDHHHHQEQPQVQQQKVDTAETTSNDLNSGTLDNAVSIDDISKEEIERNFDAVIETVESISQHSEVYLLGLQLKDEKQMKLFFTLHCLNMELAQVKSKTRGNPSMGSLRLSWWKSSIDSSLKGYPPKVPVMICLAALAREYPNALAMHRFRSWIKWRVCTLYCLLFSNINS